MFPSFISVKFDSKFAESFNCDKEKDPDGITLKSTVGIFLIILSIGMFIRLTNFFKATVFLSFALQRCLFIIKLKSCCKLSFMLSFS